MSTRSPSRVLVIAAHPDDEVLGCGGTVALHVRAGDEVHMAIACEGESLRYGAEGIGQSEHTCRAARTLGVRDVRMLGFPDQRLDTLTLTDIIGPLMSVSVSVSSRWSGNPSMRTSRTPSVRAARQVC